MAKISLTGIKPTGTPHIGNYLGSIQPALELARSYMSVYFIADWHAVTTLKDGKELGGLIHKLAATWLACGLDPQKTIFFQQSRVPELAELNWYLACYLQKSVLNHAHAYKSSVDVNTGELLKKFENQSLREIVTFLGSSSFIESAKPTKVLPIFVGEKTDLELAIYLGYENVEDAKSKLMDKTLEMHSDKGVNAGLFTYPVLMSADILLFGSDVVPVGSDQKQHVEIARDLAVSVNSQLGSVFNVPEPLIGNEVKIIPGLDGRKMSKSYDNVIPFMAPAAEVKKAVMKIVTDSKRPEDPKDPDTCNVFNIFKFFAKAERIDQRRKQYAAGGLGYGEMKEELAATLEERFGEKRKHYEELLKDTAGLDKILSEGSEKARQLGSQRMEKLRKKLGLR